MKKKIIAYVVSAVMVLTMVPATAFAATDTDGSGMSKTAPDAYTQAEQRAETYFEYDLKMAAYDTAGANAVTAIVTEYTAKIDATTVPATVESYVASAKAEIGKVVTAEQIIETYFPTGKTIASYGTDGQEAIEELRADALYALEDSTSVETTDAIVVQLKADIDAVPDATGEAAESIAKAKEEANATLDSWINKNVYEGATYRTGVQTMIDAIISGAKGKIAAVSTDVGDVQAELNKAVTELTTLTDNYKTEAQIAYEAALEKALDEDAYAKLNAYDVNEKYPSYGQIVSGKYKEYVTKILGGINDRFAKYDYGVADGNAGAAVQYNDAANSEAGVATIEDITAESNEIKAEIALIPTAATFDTMVKTWVYNAKKASGDDSYEYLESLDRQFAFWENGGSQAIRAMGVVYDTRGNAYHTEVVDARDKLVHAMEAYDTKQRTKVYKMADTVNKTYNGNVTDSNYATVIAAVDDVVAENEKAFFTRQYNTGDINDWKAVYNRQIAAQTKKIHNFVIAVGDYSDTVDGEVDYRVPTSKIMEGKKFKWGDWIENMEAAEAAYKELSATMKADPNADKYYGIYGADGTEGGPKDALKLADAISIYETAKAAYDAAGAEARAVMKLIDTIPVNYIDITDKADVDAAINAYNALPASSQGLVQNTDKLEDAAQALLNAYMKSVEKNFTTVNGTGTASWKSLNADLVDQYNSVEDTARTYGKDLKVTLRWSGNNIDAAVKAYNGKIADPNNPTDNCAAGEVAKIIKDIPRDPAKATEEDFAAVKEARAAYDALLTDEAKIEFKRAGYLAWLEDYEETMAPSEAAKDLANAEVTILGPFIEGGLPYVARGTTPEVQVTDANGDVIPESAYTVDCNEAHPAGKTSLIIRSNDGSGYTGENEAAYVVVNNKKNIKSLKGAKKSFTVKYSDYSKHGCTGTEIAWKTSKNGEWKFSKITSNKASKKITVKAAGKKYVKVRAIVKVDGIRYYSDWSKTKTVTVK